MCMEQRACCCSILSIVGDISANISDILSIYDKKSTKNQRDIYVTRGLLMLFRSNG